MYNFGVFLLVKQMSLNGIINIQRSKKCLFFKKSKKVMIITLKVPYCLLRLINKVLFHYRILNTSQVFIPIFSAFI